MSSEPRRPSALRDFNNPEFATDLLERSPPVQQEGLRFLLSFWKICEKYGNENAIDALKILKDDYLKRYTKWVKKQILVDEKLANSTHEPDPNLVSALEGENNINVPEKLLDKNPEIKQAGLEFLLCYWKINEDYRDNDVLDALKVIIDYYIERYPESLDSQPVTNGQEATPLYTNTDQKIHVLIEIFGPEWVPNVPEEILNETR